jgi:1,4-alpha-glucan branching enzyme
MLKNQSRPLAKESSKGTEFVCYAPKAIAVYLAGTFNDWSPEATLMSREEGGPWKATVPLEPGRYEYKFLIDGQWFCGAEQDDEAALLPRRERIPNPFGSLNYVLEVAPRRELGSKEK